jgi:hypothetical protein
MRFLIPAFLVLLISSCSGESEVDEVKLVTEKMPDYNPEDFFTYKYEDEFELLIPKGMSVSGLSTNFGVVEFSQLAKERHIIVERESVQKIKMSFKARGKETKNLLFDYASECLSDLYSTITNPTEYKIEQVIVHDLESVRTSFSGQPYGFPAERSYDIRVYQSQQYFYTVQCWTIKSEYESFRTAALVSSLSFAKSIK